jgi:ATP/maltotriose-dependent transcriptional regulator MalT
MSQSEDRAGAARLAARLAALARDLDEPVVRLYAEHARTIQCWDAGDVEGAFAVLGDVAATVDEVLAAVAAGRLPLSPFGSVAVTPALLGFAQLTAFSGDVARAREIFDRVETAVESWYEVTLWAVFAGTVAAQVGDPHWARRVTARCLADVGDGSRSFMDTFVGVADAWARAHLGTTAQERRAAAGALRALDEDRPPGWSGGGMWTVLLAEAWFAAGDPQEALAALDRAEAEARSRGQRHVLSFAGLVRARVLLATGTAGPEEVRALADRTRTEALAQGGRLVADRVERLLAEIA